MKFFLQNSNLKTFVSLLLGVFAFANLSADESDLKRYDPYVDAPPQQVATLGDPRIGMISRGIGQVSRVGKSDYWLLGHRQQQIALVQLDRKVGECFTRQILEAGGNWSFSGVRNLLFAGRAKDKHERDGMEYSCFEMKSNKHLWSFDSDRKVIGSAFSADHREVIVLASVSSEEKPTSKGAAVVLWLDAATGKVMKEVKLEGVTTLNRVAFIADSKHGTYVARKSEEDNRCFFIPAKGDQAEALDRKLELSQGDDVDWEIKIQPGQEKWVTFHQSQRLTLYERKAGKLVKVQNVESGGGLYGNDDCSNVRFSPDGKRLVVGSDYRTLIIGLGNSPKVEKELDYGTYDSDFSSDGEFLIFWDAGGAWPVRIKDWVSLRVEAAKERAFHCCPIETVSVSPDGKLVATTDYERILVWSAASGKLLAELTSSRLDEETRCLTHRPAWNMKSGTIYAGDGYDILEWKIADFGNGSSVARLKGKVAFGALKSRSTRPILIDVCVDKTGEHLVEIYPKSFRYRRLSNPGASRELNLGSHDFRSHPRKFTFSSDAKFLFASTGSTCFKIDLSGKSKPSLAASSLQGIATDALLAFSGQHEGGGLTIIAKDLNGGNLDGKGVKVSENYIENFAVSPDGKMAAFVSSDPQERFIVRLIDWEKREIKANLPTSALIQSLTFSPDGKFLVLGGSNRASYIWDLSKINEGK